MAVGGNTLKTTVKTIEKHRSPDGEEALALRLEASALQVLDLACPFFFLRSSSGGVTKDLPALLLTYIVPLNWPAVVKIPASASGAVAVGDEVEIIRSRGGDYTASVPRVLTVTQRNLGNNTLNLTEVLDMFPEDVLGGPDTSQAAPRTVRVQWGNEVVETDIDRTLNIFRKRGWIARFFDENQLQARDRVLLERIAPYRYRVSKA
jgi:hypothetical protein